MSAATTTLREPVSIPEPSWHHALSRHSLLWLTLGAITLRLVIFLGRGDYVAFDEGWYLLLGRNLLNGDGFTLTGLRHVTLSPLFPILAGTLSLVLGDPIWAGRLVAAITAGLLVWPCWHIFSRLADRRTAWIACAFVAVMPALAPFAAPYWIRWDLWVGAEPLLHIFLYAGLAFAVRGWQRHRAADWTLAGLALALAYLARSEGILPFGVLAAILAGRAMWVRTPRAALHAAAFVLAFAVTAAPYWLYLNDALGRWAVTGRGVQVTAPLFTRSGGTADATDAGPTARIESMLWEDDQRSYMYSLYGLDPSRTALSSGYWGIPVTPSSAPASGVTPAPNPSGAAPGSESFDAAGAADIASRRASAPPPSRWSLYARALAIAVPWYLWPFIALGLLGTRRTWRDELLVAAPLLLTSIAIARLVAVDPRTQLFLAPFLAFYVARGVRRLGVIVDRRLRRDRLRRGFIAAAAASLIVIALLGTAARWVYLGISLGSPHHLVGTANRRAGAALRDIVPPGEPVMSWHPAIALYARRDWRVLPYAPFDDMVRYATAVSSEYVVLSVYYPSPLPAEQMPEEYLLIQVPENAAGAYDGFQLIVDGVERNLAKARLMSVGRQATDPTSQQE